MNCMECRELLQLTADGEELLARSLLEQHLHTCSECSAFQRGLHHLIEVVNRDTSPHLSPDFSARLLQAVIAEGQRTQPEPVAPLGRFPWTVLLALAASLLAGLALTLYRPWVPNEVDPEPHVVENVVPLAPPSNLRESVQEAREALTSLTSKTADEVLEQTRRLLPSVPTPLLPKLDPMVQLVDPPSRDLAQAGQVVVGGFQPVTDSARRAFDLFLRDLPLGSENRPDL